MKTTDTKQQMSDPEPADEPTSVRSNHPGQAKSTTSHLKIELSIVLAIFLFALCIRYFYLNESSANPTFEAPVLDSMTYNALAKKLATGRGMTDELFWQPVFYPLYLATVYYFTDSSILCAKYLQLILGCFTCVLTYFLAKKIFGRTSGILAAGMASLYAPLVFFETELVAAGWASFWAVVIILLFLKARDTKGLFACLALGACGAISIITRPTFLPFFIAASLWLVFNFYRTSISKQFFLLRPLTILAGFALVAIPFASLCYHYTNHFSILPSSAGLNLYIGNNPNTDETIIIRPGADWTDLTHLPYTEGVRGKDNWERQQFFFDEVREYMLSQPMNFAKGLTLKTLRFFTSREMPRNVDIYMFRRWSHLLTFLMWKVGGFGFPFGLLLPMALIGLVSRWRQVPAPVKLFLLCYAASIILVFISARYRVPMVPVICCLAAGGFGTIAKTIRLKQRKKLALAAASVLAMVLLSSFIPLFPEEKVNYDAELHYGLGVFFYDSNESDKALQHYKTAVRLNPDFDAAYNNLGITLAKRRQLHDAIDNFEKALTLRPEYVKAHVNIALALLKLDKPDVAIEHLKEALNLAPGFVESHHTYALALTKMGNLDEAINHFAAFLRAQPNHPEAHYNMAKTLAKKGNVNEAIQHYSEAVRIKPDYADAHHNLANMLSKQKRFEEAAAEYLKTLQINPNDTAVHYKLALCLEQQGKFNRAIRHYTEVLGLEPDNAEAYYGLAGVYGKVGRYDMSIKAINQAIKIKPNWAKAHNNLGEAYRRLGRSNKAIQAFNKAIEIKPDSALAHSNLGAAYIDLGRYDQAANACKKAVTINPNLATAHSNLGLAYIKLRRYDEAINACKKAVQIKSDFADAHAKLGLAYLKAGDKGSAMKQYNILKSLNENIANKLLEAINE